ncbi:MAG: A/G-specific adenine glycosylase [Nanoarchaeota archaeon]
MEQREGFSTEILQWYSVHQRDLPWRKERIDPYRVVVSEFMLQQTQVSRVVEKFKEFLTLFPTIQDLAKASTAEVIQAWSGMGYNKRALLLHQFAQKVVEDYEGIIPFQPEALRKLPGIGPYTAGSIASFAFNKPEPAIDVNVRRIYLRFFQGKDQGLPMGRKEEKDLYELVLSTIPSGKSRDLHNALMDFGSLICLRDAPRCGECPLQKSCLFAPLYSTKKEKVLFVMEKKQEKGVYEHEKYIPNRIFRGRIVEFVRKNERQEISVLDFGQAIKKDYTPKEEKWLLELCQKLQKEKLLHYSLKENTITFSLSHL